MNELWGDLKHFLRLLAKVWLWSTAVIGSLVVAGVILVFILIVQLAETGSSPVSVSGKVVREGGDAQIAVVNLSGVILDDSDIAGPLSSSEGIISAKKTAELLDELLKEKELKAIVIRINSPGGAVVASDELYQKIQVINKTVPVIFSFGDVSASGGYYIAAAGSKIVANPATLTGSIGVIAEFPEVSGLMKLVGVELRTVQSGKLKDIGSPTRPFTEEEKQILQVMINEAYDQFVTAVATGRNIDQAKVRQLADGRIYTGRQAKELGLVDELGNLDRAIEIAGQMTQTDNPTVLEYSNKSFIESLFESRIAQSLGWGQLLGGLRLDRHSGMYYLWQY